MRMKLFTNAERSDRHLALRRPKKGAHTVREYVVDDHCTRARSAGQNKPSRLRAGTLHVASEQTERARATRQKAPRVAGQARRLAPAAGGHARGARAPPGLRGWGAAASGRR